MDCGYARVRNFNDVLAAEADFITRVSWGSVKMLDAKGERINVVAMLTATMGMREVPVWINGIARPLRLVIEPLPPEAAERQRARRARKANKKSQKIDPRTLLTAGFVMLITSLPAKTGAAQVLARYRDRWQVEIGFKRMKTLAGSMANTSSWMPSVPHGRTCTTSPSTSA
jgi:IS4 transposase